MVPWGHFQLVSLLLPRPSFASCYMQASLLDSAGLTYVGAEMAIVPFLEEKFSPKIAGLLLCLRRCSYEASAKSLPWNDLTYTNIIGKKNTFNSSFPVMLRALGLSFVNWCAFLAD